jgi:DNA-binding Xre family transcriptional regulator
MVLNYTKIEAAGANKQMSMKDIYQKGRMARATLERIRDGNSVTMKTAGKLAAVLGVNVTELLQEGQ